MALGPDPYEVLGVPRDATGEQIAQARRRLSRELHPDVNSAPDAADRFGQVQHAFDVLSDPAARAEYDRGARDKGTAAETAGKGAGGAKGPGAAEAAGAAGAAGQATEVAPGIFVQPASVDFGVLRLGRKAYATVTVAWTGKRPAQIRTGIVGPWWIRLIHQSPAPGSVVFSLCAQAPPDGPLGRQNGQFTVTLDGTWFGVDITAEFRDAAPAAASSAQARQAEDSLPLLVIWLPLVVLALVSALIWPGALAARWDFGSPASTTAPPAQPAVSTADPTPVPVIVEQTVWGASGADGAVQPAFTASSLGADRARALRDGLAWPPVQRGPELLLPIAAPPSGPGPAQFCVSVTVPGTGGTTDRTAIEQPLGTVTGTGGPELAFPSVLPGRYQLDPSCAPAGDAPAAGLVTLGTVSPDGLGVTGAGAQGTLEVYGTHDDGTSTTVSYTAAGPPGAPAPASQACVLKLTSDGQPVHWQPVQSTVTQRVTGTGGWLETGTLVFRLPPGRPDYFTGDCVGAVEDASSGGELGVRLP